MSTPTPPEFDVSPVIQDFHALMRRNEDAVTAAYPQLVQEMVKRKLTYDGRIMTPFLRPQFVTAAQYGLIAKVCRPLRSALTKAKNLVFEHPEFLEFLGLTQGERLLVNIDPGFKSIGVTARLDSFLIGDKIKFVELNCECPAGIAYCDRTAALFEQLDFIKEFRALHGFMHTDVSPKLLAALLETWSEFGGAGKPSIAVVDWKEVHTRTEFDLVCEIFGQHGIEAFFADPRELKYDGKQLTSANRRIDLIYRRVLTNEFLANFEEVQPMYRALRDGNVCVVNSFRAKLLHKKIVFALLHHEAMMSGYTEEEKHVVKETIPWTARVQEGLVEIDGQKTNLVKYMLGNRQKLVIKPNDDYGGRGVVVGRHTDPDEWERAVHVALVDPSVVQAVVEVPSADFPEVDQNGKLVFAPKYIDLDPYLFRGEVGGILTRLSTTSKCNVTAGGGMVPTFVLDK